MMKYSYIIPYRGMESAEFETQDEAKAALKEHLQDLLDEYDEEFFGYVVEFVEKLTCERVSKIDFRNELLKI